MSASGSNQGLRAGVCLSTTRPAAPFDGQMIYETDTNLVRIWNGSAWKTLSYSDYTSGSVIQVQSTTKTDTFSTTSTTFTDVTGLSVSITPTSTSSKILVSANITGTALTVLQFLQLVRDSTAIGVGDSRSNRSRVGTMLEQQPSGSTAFATSMSVLDTPSTVSTVSYKVQTRAQAAGTIYINRSVTDSDTSSYWTSASTITVMEIAG